jgi:hypothetical protein
MKMDIENNFYSKTTKSCSSTANMSDCGVYVDNINK